MTIKDKDFRPIQSLDEIKSGDHLKVNPENGPINRLENITPGEIRNYKYWLHTMSFDEQCLDITDGKKYHEGNGNPENAAGTVITSVEVKQGRVYKYDPSQN